MVQYARISVKDALLNKDFGELMAKRYFGGDVVDALPRASKGKNKGRIKDHRITWRKVEQGGWVKGGAYCFDTMQAAGHVERRVGKIIEVELVHTPFKGKDTVIKTWECAPGDDCRAPFADKFPFPQKENSDAVPAA